jgi:hypothetical protein
MKKCTEENEGKEDLWSYTQQYISQHSDVQLSSRLRQFSANGGQLRQFLYCPLAHIGKAHPVVFILIFRLKLNVLSIMHTLR